MSDSSHLAARAYATLGLAPGASRREIVRQYKRLVKRWHPDRYVNDPQGYAEAAERLREINRAFALLRKSAGADTISGDAPPPSTDKVSSPPRVRVFGQRLRESDIEEIADAIGSPGIIEALGRYFVRGACAGAGLLLLGYGGHAGWRTPRRVEVVLGVILLGLATVSVVRGVFRDRR